MRVGKLDAGAAAAGCRAHVALDMLDMRGHLLVLLMVGAVVLIAGLVHVLAPGLGLGVGVCLGLKLCLGRVHVHLVMHVSLELLGWVDWCGLDGDVMLLLLLLLHRLLVKAHGFFWWCVLIEVELLIVIALSIELVAVRTIIHCRGRSERICFDLDRAALARLSGSSECVRWQACHGAAPRTGWSTG